MDISDNYQSSTDVFDSSYVKRIFSLLRVRRWFITGVVAVFALFAFTNALFDVPIYKSEHQLQVDAYSLGKSINKDPLLSNDVMSGRSLVNGAVSLIRSDLFMAALAEEIQKSQTKDDLVIITEIGVGLRINYALYRLGLLREVTFKKIDISTMQPEALGVLLGRMIETTPNYSEKMVMLKTKTVESRTAYLINKSVMAAYGKAMTRMNQKQLETSINFYTEQVKAARAKLDQADDNVTQFLRVYPTLATDGSMNQFMSDYSNLRSRVVQFQQEVDINSQLYGYYKAKYMSFDKASDSNLDMINKLKQELVELKYRKQTYEEKGYDSSNPGILGLNGQIKRVESMIKKNSSAFSNVGGGNSVVSLGYLERISARLEELQDAMRIAKLNLSSVEAQLTKLRPQVSTILQQSITLQGLKRETMISAELFNELSRKLQLVRARATGEDTVIAAINEPTLDSRPIGLPSSGKIFFAFIVGLALAISMILMQETIWPKIIDRHSVELMGFKYGGFLSRHIANQAEVLSSIGCLDDVKSGKGPRIILCASPGEIGGFNNVSMLSSYLSKQKRKSLTIVVSGTAVPTTYKMTDDMGFAKIYRQPEGFEDIVHITDPDTFSAMRSLLDQFGSKYHVIFIYVADAVSNLGYHMAQRVAKQLVLIGEIAAYSANDYSRLVRGFTNQAETYVVLTQSVNGRTFAGISKYLKDDDEPPSAEAGSISDGVTEPDIKTAA